VEYLVCVISSGRAEAIRGLTLGLFPDAPVVVPPEQVADYEAAGCTAIPQSGRGVSNARNTVLDTFVGDHNVLMLDDDVRALGHFTTKNNKDKVVWDTPEMRQERLGQLFDALDRARGWAFSGAPTTNAFYYNPRRPTATNLFLIGTFSGYRKGCPVRYDETLPLKEDYDFTVKVWKACGLALRFNNVWCDAIHYSNAGGCVAYRDDATEAQAIAILRERYPNWIKPHPTRGENEVVLKLPDYRAMLARAKKKG